MSSRAPSRSDLVEAARKRIAPLWHRAYTVVPPLKKGDFDGHPFRGNQYSDVASGGEGPAKRPSAQQEAIARGRAERLRGTAIASRSPEFQTWFAGSKAVDAAGLPLAVFHGSFAIGIEEFDRHQGGAWADGIKTVDTAGSWFTTDAKQAESIFSPGPNAPPDDGALYRVHLAIRNPKVLGDWQEIFSLAKWVGADIPGKKGTESIDGDRLREKLIARGFDGLHIKGAAKIDGGQGDYWVAFHPHQIKATTNQRPTSAPSIHKGDLEGHPFRGNQYTQGEGGGGHDTPEFKAWFGDSKVVTAEGKPLVVYHGTTEKDPTTLDESFEAGAGIFLTDNESVADTFTLPREYGEPVFEDEDGNEIEAGTVVAAYVSMQNPLVISGREAQDVVEDTPLQTRTIARAKASGHDGIILRGVMEGIGERYRSDNFIVFDPAQVKAKENTRPTKHPDLAKGDFEGHPFRGNQYTDGVGGGDGEEPWRSSKEAFVGPWPDGGYVAESEPIYAALQAREKEWNRSVAVAVSLGQMTPEAAEKAGWRELGGGEKMERLPSVLYHATTAATAVEEDDLKTRDELGQASGRGIGGGASNTVSFTTDPVIAEAVANGLREMRRVAQGELTAAMLIENARTGADAKQPYIGPVMRAIGGGEPGMDDYLASRERAVHYPGPPRGKHEWSLDEKEGENKLGWRPVKDARPGPNGTPMRWERDWTPEEKIENAITLYKACAAFREHAGGVMDPLFFCSDYEAFAKQQDSEIKVLRFVPRAGAMGYRVSGMKEWRTFTGRAVILTGEGRLNG
jgi:hypothetical protein